MQKILRKILVILIIIGLHSSAFLTVGSTRAYFNDSESSDNNVYQAGVLDMEISEQNLQIAVNEEKSFQVLDNGSISFEYSLNLATTTGSDLDFCDDLEIVLYKDGNAISTTTPMTDLDLEYIISDSEDDFSFKINDNGGNVSGKVCSIVLEFKAWQEELSYSQGFIDDEKLEITIYSQGTSISAAAAGDVVLNEFLPNPDSSAHDLNLGDDSDDAPYGEWVELYNNSTTTSFDLSGWYIEDLIGGKVDIKLYNSYDFSENASSTVIKPQGWLVFYMNKRFLNNVTGSDVEEIKLYNSSGNLQDETSYTGSSDYCELDPTPGDDNDSDPDDFGGSCSSVPPNKSYARIPDGIGEWIDPIPTPGDTNATPENLEIAEELENQDLEITEEVLFEVGIIDTPTTTEEIIEFVTTTEETIELVTSTPEMIESATTTKEVIDEPESDNGDDELGDLPPVEEDEEISDKDEDEDITGSEELITESTTEEEDREPYNEESPVEEDETKPVEQAPPEVSSVEEVPIEEQTVSVPEESVPAPETPNNEDTGDSE
jgi:predicted ribosomally synthesized peptide with SipW-like signal peptide